MTDWRPSSDASAAARRAAMIRRLRDRFEREEVLEVDTPALSAFAISDTNIESMAVASQLQRAPLFLHTSPEFCMKRLLAAGYPDIYSICRVFRDGEAGRSHQPEFTLLEWYRLGMNLEQIIDDTLATIFAGLGNSVKVNATRRLTYQEAIMNSCGIDPLSTTSSEIASELGADRAMCRTLGEDLDGWLDLLLAERVFPGFRPEEITIVSHYPASQAALSRLCPDDPRVAERFEVFLGAVELANGYVELTDASEQRQRIERDQASRKQRGMTLRPTDSEFLAALESGMPDCAGVAMGLERLQMVQDKTDDIRDVVTFAYGQRDD